MSKGTSSDPQWIVSNREDGTNVNAWHWVEHDVLPFLQEHADELLCGQCFGGEPADTPKITVKTKADSGVKVTGEATANNRRGKTIYIYELSVAINYNAVMPDGKQHKGTVTFPYIGEDTEPDDWEIRVSCTTSGASEDTKDTVALAVRKVATKALRAKFADVLELMREHFRCHAPSGNQASSGASSLPPGVTSQATVAAVAQAVKKTGEAHDTVQESKSRAEAGSSTLEFEERFATSAMELYEVLLDGNRMSMVTGGAKIEKRVGGSFSLFNGAVTGFITEMTEGKRIVQRWRFSSWRTGAFSTVTMTLSERSGDTILRLKQEGIPEDDKARTEAGWRQNIFNRIRGIFGFGGIPMGF